MSIRITTLLHMGTTLLSPLYDSKSIAQTATQQLLCHLTQKNLTELFSHNNVPEEIEEVFYKTIELMVKTSKPLAYVLENTYFMNIPLAIRPPILIPRPETEYWLSSLFDYLRDELKFSPTSIIDMCTGSGCIACSCALTFPTARIIASDISLEAISLAQENVNRHQLSQQVEVRQSDLFERYNDHEKCNLFLANPPYINPLHTENLQKCVLDWEDHRALFDREDGTFITKKILSHCKNFILSPGIIAIEINEFHVETLLSFAQKMYPLKKNKVIYDQYDKPRTLVILN